MSCTAISRTPAHVPHKPQATMGQGYEGKEERPPKLRFVQSFHEFLPSFKHSPKTGSGKVCSGEGEGSTGKDQQWLRHGLGARWEGWAHFTFHQLMSQSNLLVCIALRLLGLSLALGLEVCAWLGSRAWVRPCLPGLPGYCQSPNYACVSKDMLMSLAYSWHAAPTQSRIVMVDAAAQSQSLSQSQSTTSSQNEINLTTNAKRMRLRHQRRPPSPTRCGSGSGSLHLLTSTHCWLSSPPAFGPLFTSPSHHATLARIVIVLAVTLTHATCATCDATARLSLCVELIWSLLIGS